MNVNASLRVCYSLCVGLPKDTENLEEMPCVIDKLCELHDGLVVEAKGIKEHYFKPYIKTLFEKKVRNTLFYNQSTLLEQHNCWFTAWSCFPLSVSQILKGDVDTLTELLDTPNFQDNK